MITGAILQMIYSLVAFFIGFLPVIPLPAGVNTAFVTVFAYLNAWSFLIPVSTFLTVLSFAISFHVILLGYDLSLKVYHMVRGR